MTTETLHCDRCERPVDQIWFVRDTNEEITARLCTTCWNADHPDDLRKDTGPAVFSGPAFDNTDVYERVRKAEREKIIDWLQSEDGLKALLETEEMNCPPNVCFAMWIKEGRHLKTRDEETP